MCCGVHTFYHLLQFYRLSQRNVLISDLEHAEPADSPADVYQKILQSGSECHRDKRQSLLLLTSLYTAVR
jgi:hypothetical protein